MLPFLVALAFVLFLARRSVNCPNCGNVLSPFASPFRKTRRMWRAGGYLCARCGCESDMAGHKVTAGTPPARVPVLQWVVLALLLLVGGAAAGLILNRPAAVGAPPRTAAPPVVPAPQH